MPGIFTQLKEQYKDILLSLHSQCGDYTIVISKENFKKIVLDLKNHPDWKLDTLIDLTAVDYLPEGREARFEMVYHFYSMVLGRRLRIKVPITEEDAVITTLSDVWPHANWYEREVWDMFGIKFQNHPDMRRLLLYEEFEGHPLRKDYPFNKQQPILDIE